MSDPDLLPPSIDPTTNKIAIRSVSGRNEGGTRTELQVRHFAPFATDEPDTLGGTNSAPSPLETALASLAGCKGVIINGCASAMKFEYSGVDVQVSGQIDVRGPKGVPGIRPFFEKTDVTIVIETNETQARVDKLKKNVEFRCPIMNLFRSAGVDLTTNWQVVPAKG